MSNERTTGTAIEAAQRIITREVVTFRKNGSAARITKIVQSAIDTATADLQVQCAAMRNALEKISGFGRSAHGTPDLTFDELAGYVNETCEEALSTQAGADLLAKLSELEAEAGRLRERMVRIVELAWPEKQAPDRMIDQAALARDQKK